MPEHVRTESRRSCGHGRSDPPPDDDCGGVPTLYPGLTATDVARRRVDQVALFTAASGPGTLDAAAAQGGSVRAVRLDEATHMVHLTDRTRSGASSAPSSSAGVRDIRQR